MLSGISSTQHYLQMVEGAYVMFVKHGRPESDAADAAERHQEAFHSPVCIGEVVRVASGAVVEAAHKAKGGARSQLRTRGGLEFSLRAALRHAHAQQLRLMPPCHATHGRTVLARNQMFHIPLASHKTLNSHHTQ
jgi:hypothetical protein